MSQSETPARGKGYILLSSQIHGIKKARRISPQLVLCPHCKKQLSLKTYKKHKSLYYRNHRWKINEDSDEGHEEDTAGLPMQ